MAHETKPQPKMNSMTVFSKYVAPSFNAVGFHCPHCGVYAHQNWKQASFRGRETFTAVPNLWLAFCAGCAKYSIWHRKKLVYPALSIAPLPVPEMPDDVEQDFLEARDIVNASPRAAAALLRLALQKLMIHLGEKGKDLNKDIGNLVKKGLSERVQKALDAVRVIGNNAVHPGKIDLKDDVKTANSLFRLINMIVTIMITQPKEVDEIYETLPDSSKEAILKRNSKP